VNFTPLDVTYMSTIKTEVQEISETRKKVNVDIAAAEVDGIQKQLVKEFQREAKIPGFRPGKTPENLIRMRFAKELKTELVNRVVNRAYQEGVGKADFEIFSLVGSSKVEVVDGQDASVSFTVDVVQEFDVPDYGNLKIS
jgi:trigger factor